MNCGGAGAGRRSENRKQNWILERTTTWTTSKNTTTAPPQLQRQQYSLANVPPRSATLSVTVNPLTCTKLGYCPSSCGSTTSKPRGPSDSRNDNVNWRDMAQMVYTKGWQIGVAFWLRLARMKQHCHRQLLKGAAADHSILCLKYRSQKIFQSNLTWTNSKK